MAHMHFHAVLRQLQQVLRELCLPPSLACAPHEQLLCCARFNNILAHLSACLLHLHSP